MVHRLDPRRTFAIRAVLAMLVAVAFGGVVSPAAAQDANMDPELEKLFAHVPAHAANLDQGDQSDGEPRDSRQEGSFHPGEVKEKDRDTDSNSDSSGDIELLTVAGTVADYDRLPAVRGAITSAGLTTREYVTFQLIAGLVGLAKYSLKQGSDAKPTALEKENIDFLKKHEAEFTRWNQVMMSLTPPDAGAGSGAPPSR